MRGPAVIGAGCRLRDAYVGPYTSIGHDVVIEGAEVEHSIVMPEASIRHLGGRLEASVVGPHARVFRDFRLPRALRLTVGRGRRGFAPLDPGAPSQSPGLGYDTRPKLRLSSP